jgi:hypothetical protein
MPLLFYHAPLSTSGREGGRLSQGQVAMELLLPGVRGGLGKGSDHPTVTGRGHSSAMRKEHPQLVGFGTSGPET